eukprot:5426014-Pyramimonas_sp.AAC.1
MSPARPSTASRRCLGPPVLAFPTRDTRSLDEVTPIVVKAYLRQDKLGMNAPMGFRGQAMSVKRSEEGVHP